MWMKRILVLVFNHLGTDVRVQRQIQALKAGNEVSIACYGGEIDDSISITELEVVRPGLRKKLLIVLATVLRRYMWAYWLLFDYRREAKAFSQEHFDLVVANDVETLPLAFAIKVNGDTRVLLDAHEYADSKWSEDE